MRNTLLLIRFIFQITILVPHLCLLDEITEDNKTNIYSWFLSRNLSWSCGLILSRNGSDTALLQQEMGLSFSTLDLNLLQPFDSQGWPLDIIRLCLGRCKVVTGYKFFLNIFSLTLQIRHNCINHTICQTNVFISFLWFCYQWFSKAPNN